MPRLCPNLFHQFTELDIRDRFPAAAALGFDAVEWHFPHQLPKSDLKRLLDDNGLRFVYGVIPVDWTKGEFGLGGQPGREEEFRRAADKGLDYAAHCNFWSLQIGHGALPGGEHRQRCIETLARNLQYVCDQAKGTDLRIVIEPVATARFNIPFVLSTMEHGAQVLRLVGQDRLRLVFDTYHLRMQEQADLTAILHAYWPLIGHVQIGNAPTRNEPGVGEIDLCWLIDQVEAKGYDGWIGLEYDPSIDTWASLRWASRYGYPIRGRDEMSPQAPAGRA
jgi:hydroxypyruvate isomerase